MVAIAKLPLSSHAPEQALAHDLRGPVPTGRYFAEVLALAPRLAGAGHVLNLCEDRYAFMVGLGAALVAGAPTLMPSSTAPSALAGLASRYPNLVGLHDEAERPAELPPQMAALHVPDRWGETLAWADAPMIAEDQLAVIMFTSGSQGAPTPHPKPWRTVCKYGMSELDTLGTAGMTIVATVPAQHMFGFEYSTLFALHGGSSCWRGKPFYPSDVVAALAATPRPRMLVITPFHLSKVLDAGIPLPQCDALVCATAPLSAQLAARAESAFGAPLREIYGSTECAQIACRRTSVEPDWQLVPGVTMEHDAAGTWVHGGHIEERMLLSDVIEPTQSGRFRLAGRHADMVNIAGRRTSIDYLNAQLLSIDGVQDGCFVQPQADAQDGVQVTRLAALCVAPGLDAGQVLAALRTRIDQVFLPRPLRLVAALPRNDTGKLARGDLLALLGAKEPGA